MKVFINHKKKGRFPIKQISKRVSAALLAVLMVLSLLPQTVLALDPDQRQAERREGYDVATVSGGHSTYANGGVGSVAGQFGDGSIANSYNYGNVTLGEGLVCNNLGGRHRPGYEEKRLPGGERLLPGQQLRLCLHQRGG